MQDDKYNFEIKSMKRRFLYSSVLSFRLGYQSSDYASDVS